MNDLKIFNYQDYDVRVIEVDGEHWWVLKDVCDVLDLSNPTIVAERLDEDEVTKFNLGSLSGKCNIINESGLYSVILRSDKPEAKPFRKWITSEVIPSIRKHGSYSLPDITITETTTLTKQERIKVMEIISKASNYTLPYVLDLASPYLSEDSLKRIAKKEGDKLISVSGCEMSISEFIQYCDESGYEFEGRKVPDVYNDYLEFCKDNSYKPINRNTVSRLILSENNLYQK